MFPVFTSRALALTLSFLYAAVLVYSQTDLCIEDDLLIALRANRDGADEFCRADLQVPDIYNTYLATTLRRTATAFVTTTITVNIPSARTVPSSTRTITLRPIDTTSLNENRKRAPYEIDLAPFYEAVPLAREVADGSAEGDLLSAFSSACSCLFLEPRTFSVPETTRTLTAIPRVTTTRYRRTVTAGITTVTVRTGGPLTTRTISLIPAPRETDTSLSISRVVIVPSGSPTLPTNTTSFFGSLSPLTSGGTINVSVLPTLSANSTSNVSVPPTLSANSTSNVSVLPTLSTNSTSFPKTLPTATFSGRFPVSNLPFPSANSTRLTLFRDTSAFISPSASPARSRNITSPSGSPAISSANSTGFSFTAVLSPATSIGTIIPPRSANTSTVLRPTAFNSPNSSFPATLIVTGIPRSTNSPTTINGSAIPSSTSVNSSRTAVTSPTIDLKRFLELSSSCFSLGLFSTPVTTSISVVTTTVFVTATILPI